MADSADSRPAGRQDGKSASAFRTITEVADALEIPQHVLRFWETRFPQIRPLKRGGGRRYYRPEDVALLERIRRLLYVDGYTIKGAQKLLRQGNAKAAPADAPATEEAEQTGPPSQQPSAGAPAPLDAVKRAELEALLTDLEDLRDVLRSQSD